MVLIFVEGRSGERRIGGVGVLVGDYAVLTHKSVPGLMNNDPFDSDFRICGVPRRPSDSDRTTAFQANRN
jgi:hypothetical protein